TGCRQSPPAVAAAPDRDGALCLSQPHAAHRRPAAECPSNPPLHDSLPEAGRPQEALFAPCITAYLCHPAAPCWGIAGGGQRAAGASLPRRHAPLYATV